MSRFLRPLRRFGTVLGTALRWMSGQLVLLVSRTWLVLCRLWRWLHSLPREIRDAVADKWRRRHRAVTVLARWWHIVKLALIAWGAGVAIRFWSPLGQRLDAVERFPRW